MKERNRARMYKAEPTDLKEENTYLYALQYTKVSNKYRNDNSIKHCYIQQGKRFIY